jgi:hypothetical protein
MTLRVPLWRQPSSSEHPRSPLIRTTKHEFGDVVFRYPDGTRYANTYRLHTLD